MYVVGRLVFEADADVVPILNRLIPGGVVPHYRQAVGFLHQNEIAGGALFFGLLPGVEIEIAMAAATPRAVGRGVLRELVAHAFSHFNVRRVTAHTDAENLRARRALERVGFAVEGRKRQASPRGDVMIYGLLKEDVKLWSAPSPRTRMRRLMPRRA